MRAADIGKPARLLAIFNFAKNFKPQEFENRLIYDRTHISTVIGSLGEQSMPIL
jgi:hypothetical protein